MAKRVTQHNGRAGSGGAYLAKHNDRQFDLATAKHIDGSKSSGNLYWKIYDGLSFEECEKRYYEKKFGKALALQNEKYEKKRQYGYMRTMDDYRRNPKTCPEEQIIYIGNKNDSVDVDTLLKIALEQTKWERKTFPNVVVLNFALHVDEQGAPHIHKRQVWTAVDKNGNMVVSQTKALQQMGVGADRKGTRYDNAKQVYTAQCREHFEGLCRQYGIELETERLEASKTGLEMDDYKASQAEKRAKMADIRAVEAEKRAELAESKLFIAEREKNGLEAQIEALDMALVALRGEKREAEAQASEAEKKAAYLEKKVDALVLVAKPKGYMLENERLQACIDFFANKPEDSGLFGKKGTYTLSSQQFHYIRNTLDQLSHTVRDIMYLKLDNQKQRELMDELVKQRQKAEEALESYQRIKMNIPTVTWDKLVADANKNIRRKQAIAQEQLARMRNARNKSNDGMEM